MCHVWCMQEKAHRHDGPARNASDAASDSAHQGAAALVLMAAAEHMLAEQGEELAAAKQKLAEQGEEVQWLKAMMAIIFNRP